MSSQTSERVEQLAKLPNEILDTLRRESGDMAERALLRLNANGADTSPVNARVNIEVAQAFKLAGERLTAIVDWYAASVLSDTYGYCLSCSELEPLNAETSQCADCDETTRDDREMVSLDAEGASE